jgi:hypothetical protein
MPKTARSQTDRLRAAAEHYATAANPDGGWGAFPESASSIVNTAEVLALLRTAGFRPSHRTVDRAVRYIADAASAHFRPKAEGGRDPHIRFLSFGLLGLTEYPAFLVDAHVRGGIDFCCERLQRQVLRAGGWPGTAGERQLSVFQTTTAIIALAGIGAHPKLVARGADALLKLRDRDGALRAQSRRGPASVPHTALGAIGLYHAGREREAARAARWLYARPAEWQEETHKDGAVRGAGWVHMTFGLATQALLLTGVATYYDEPVAHAVDFMDRLWLDDACEWRDGDVDSDQTSVRATYAVALSYRELARNAGVLTIDAARESPEPTPPHAKRRFERPALESGLVVQVAASPNIMIGPVGERGVAIRLGDAEWRIVKAAVEQGAFERPIAVQEAADALYPDSKDNMGTLERTCRRLNTKVRKKVSVERLIRVSRGRLGLAVAPHPSERVEG